MSSSKDRRAAARLCGRLGEDDGIDPRDYFDNRERGRDLRKARQLCKQVARTLDLVLSGELDDDMLRNLIVDAVEPAPNASRLLVILRPTTNDELVDVPAVLERLAALRGRLRAEVASSIHRRKVPDLVFQIAVDHRGQEDAR